MAPIKFSRKVVYILHSSRCKILFKAIVISTYQRKVLKERRKTKKEKLCVLIGQDEFPWITPLSRWMIYAVRSNAS